MKRVEAMTEPKLSKKGLLEDHGGGVTVNSSRIIVSDALPAKGWTLGSAIN